MAIHGQGALGIWIDVLPEAEEDFNRWYAEQHLPERLGVPGFLRGRRYRAARGTPKYFTLYETESTEVLRSPAYLARLNNPTDWTRRVLPTMGYVRNVYRFLHAEGGEEGQAIVTLRLDPAPGREEELRALYRDQVLEEMTRAPGVLSAALFEAEQVATGVMTEERRLVRAGGAAPPFLCLCELREPGIVDQPAWRALLAPDGPARKDVVRDATENAYRLIYSLSRAQP